jgi:CDP-diacylglycerol--serine O-phosphatidyltransferase
VGAHTRFGREFDSFADFITFGVAPIVLLYDSLAFTFGFWAWLIGGVYLISGAFRLTRHNLMYDGNSVSRYLGLPITSAGMTLAAYVLLSGEISSGPILAWPSLISILILSGLMVSTLEYERFAFVSRIKPLWKKFLLSILIAIPIIIYPRLLLFGLMTAYIFYGVVRNLVIRNVQKPIKDSNWDGS